MSCIFAGLISIAGATVIAPSQLPNGLIVRKLDTGERVPREYALYIPPNYNRDKAWPVIIFLHGSGERGYNSHLPTHVGLAPEIPRYRPGPFPFIVIFPQVSDMWFKSKQEEWVWRMLDSVKQEFRVDSDRIYLTGLSMGGFGTWDIAMRHPDRFAAIAPVCGGSLEPQLLGNLVGMPIWAFHGELDPNVPLKASAELINALQKAGDKPKFTQYADLGHNCWDRAYATPGLYRWFLEHQRRHRPQSFTYRMPDGPIPPPHSVWWIEFQAVSPNIGDMAATQPTRSAVPAASKGPVAGVRLDGNVIQVATQNVTRLRLISDQMPPLPGDDITVVWNRKKVYHGPVNGDILLRMQNNEYFAAIQGATSVPSSVGEKKPLPS